MSVEMVALEDMLFAPIVVSTSGDSVVVPGVPGTKIRVVHLLLIPEAPVVIQWKSGATAISGAMRLVASGGYETTGIFGVMESAPGAALILNLSVAVNVGGHLAYILI